MGRTGAAPSVGAWACPGAILFSGGPEGRVCVQRAENTRPSGPSLNRGRRPLVTGGDSKFVGVERPAFGRVQLTELKEPPAFGRLCRLGTKGTELGHFQNGM